MKIPTHVCIISIAMLMTAGLVSAACPTTSTTCSTPTCSTAACSSCVPAFVPTLTGSTLKLKDTTTCKHVADKWIIKRFSDSGKTKLVGYIEKTTVSGATLSMPATKGYYSVCLQVKVGSCWCSKTTCKAFKI